MSNSVEPLRLALVGCGDVTRYKHLLSLRQVRTMSIVALCDVDLASLNRCGEFYGVAARYSSLHTLLADPVVEAIGICTPPETHEELALAAMAAGKHVWIDKPLALEREACRRLTEAARQVPGVCMTGFHMRFHRLIARARGAIARGELGKIESIRAVWHSPKGTGRMQDWKLRRETGGGALVEIGVHCFDLCCFLLDTQVEEVFAYTVDGVRHDMNSVAAARLADGTFATIEVSEQALHEIEVTVSGSRGTLRVDCLRFDGYELRRKGEVPGAPSLRLRQLSHFVASLPGGLRGMSDGGDYRDSYKQAWLAFSHAVRSGLPSPCSFASGWIAMEGSNAAVESCASRLPVRCQKIVASDASSAIGAAESLVPVAGAECGEESTVFSVLVPTFDRPRHLPRLLDSLARQTFSKERFEVVIVNDGGRKPLDEIVGAYRDRLRIVSIVLERSLGCSGARRKAFEAASGRYLAFTDDDCRPVPSWLSDAYRHVSGNPSTAVAGPTVNALTGNLFSEATQVVVQWAASKRCERGGGLEFSPTSNLIFRRERLIAAGGLRDDWKIPGGEDRDLCRRWIQAGGTIRFEASAIVHHFHQLDLAGFLRQHFGYGRGAARFRWMERSDLRNDSRSLEGWSFYAGLLREPFRTQSIRRAFALTALLVLSQVATLAGVIRELLSHLPSASNGGVFAPKETSIQ